MLIKWNLLFIIGTEKQGEKILNQHVMPSVPTQNLRVCFMINCILVNTFLRFLEHGIRRYLPLSIAKTIATALVTSRCYYCNSFYIILLLGISQNYKVLKIVWPRM